MEVIQPALPQTEELKKVEVMDRASAFLRQQFRLIPAEVGPSIQSLRQREVPPGTDVILEPPSGVPQFEDAPRDGEAAPDVGTTTIGRVERDMDTVGEEDYGSDEDRCSAYLRALEVLMERGRIVGHQALTHRRELLLIRAYIQWSCTERFHSCFETRGWSAVETLQMLAD